MLNIYVDEIICPCSTKEGQLYMRNEKTNNYIIQDEQKLTQIWPFSCMSLSLCSIRLVTKFVTNFMEQNEIKIIKKRNNFCSCYIYIMVFDKKSNGEHTHMITTATHFTENSF